VVLGGVVRITGSGLACPDWPACQGRAIPDFTNYRVAIEYSHRLFGTAATLLVLATAATAFALHRRQRGSAAIPLGLVNATGVGLLLIAVQVVLGGITVLVGNSPFTVAMHLGNALLALAAALLVALWASRVIAPTAGSDGRSPAALIYSGAVAAYAIVITGAYVVGSGASSACSGWPPCGSAGGSADIHMLHRIVAGLAGLVIIAGMYVARRRWHGSALALVAYLTMAGVLLEVAVGAVQVLTALPVAVRAVHLALATAVWSGTVLLAAAYWLETRSERKSVRVRQLTVQAESG